MSANHDSADLEALFEQTLAQTHPELLKQKNLESVLVNNENKTQAPFNNSLNNSSVDKNSTPANSTTSSGADKPELYAHIGALARKLHDALLEVGRGEAIASANEHLPQDRERLAFIGQLMEQSAVKVLNTCETQMPILDHHSEQLLEQQRQWNRFLLGELTLPEFKALATAQPDVFSKTAHIMNESKDAFLNIVMAQDFQDLAGQTLSKIIKHVSSLEQDLIRLLAFAAVEPERKEKIEDFLAGPKFAEHQTDTVSSQEEVDDLLKELGF